MKISTLMIGSVCALGLAGCGGTSSSTVTGSKNPRVVAVNALSTGQNVDVFYNQEQIASGLQFGQVSPTAIETNDTPTIAFRDSTSHGTIVTETAQTFLLNTNYAVVAFDNASGATTSV